jgi:hypothetical protein
VSCCWLFWSKYPGIDQLLQDQNNSGTAVHNRLSETLPWLLALLGIGRACNSQVPKLSPQFFPKVQTADASEPWDQATEPWDTAKDSKGTVFAGALGRNKGKGGFDVSNSSTYTQTTKPDLLSPAYVPTFPGSPASGAQSPTLVSLC